MKIKTFLIPAAVLLGSSLVVNAELPRRAAAKAAMERSGRGEVLTAEEREKLKAAREKAIQDPEVKAATEKRKAAEEEFRTVMHKALLAADPSLQPILDKVKSAGGPGLFRGGERRRGLGGSPRTGKAAQ